MYRIILDTNQIESIYSYKLNKYTVWRDGRPKSVYLVLPTFTF